jgi:hypothetical protein
LADADPSGTITINNSEFSANGVGGDGHTHNIYVNEIATLTITNSHIHDANIGHEIKSRAENTVIENSRIFDNNSTASYSIDLPNGGNADIENNVIEQGPNSQNPYIIAYGEEIDPPTNPANPGTVTIANNVIINDLPQSDSPQLLLNRTTTALGFQNNQVYGLTPAEVDSGTLNEVNAPQILTAEPALNTASAWDVGILCFLSGTMIATPAGDVKVEALAVGDIVRTVGGQNKIVWIGTGRVLATRSRRNAATPVTVRKGALAENVPHSDLRVTKGHALYIDGALIPVECLVNHRSIVWDDHAQEVDIYHIELETHDVLLANGAPAESYRDDGNRWLFRNANSGWALPPKPRCAPLLTGGPAVDAIWRRLLERAGPRPGFPLTDEPDLHLLVDGRRVDASVRDGMRYVFRLATRPFEVHVRSRASAPQELGLTRDPRALGVALRRIGLSESRRTRVVDARDRRLTQGFHRFEADGGIRWTNGDARLPRQMFAGFAAPMDLTIELGCATHYLDDDAASRAA